MRFCPPNPKIPRPQTDCNWNFVLFLEDQGINDSQAATTHGRNKRKYDNYIIHDLMYLYP